MSRPSLPLDSLHDDLLHELGIGPIWRLRQTEVVAAIESELETSAEATFTELKVESSTNDSPISDLNWNELHQRVSGCERCGLCAGRANTVFGVGDQAARVLFVGEGPGYNENLQGEPFVGVAGQLLDNILRALGMQRGQATYIANVVKCRPTDASGKDRPPTSEEIAACLPYLQRQIQLIQPQLIVALGKTAAIALLNLDIETPVSQLRGRVHRYHQIPLIVTYHPAYLLRKPTEKAKVWADLCLGIAELSHR